MLKDAIKQEILTELECENYAGRYVCDLTNHMYGEDTYIIGIYNAKEFLKENFDEMLEALQYYYDEIGEQFPFIQDIERLASYTVLSIAERIFSAADIDSDIWNDLLSAENRQVLIDCIKAAEVD